MSVTAKDHRRFIEGKEAEEAKKEAEKPKVLLEQVAIANETGDPRFDKLLRTIAAMIEKDSSHLLGVAMKGMDNQNEQADRIMRSEFMFVKGRIAAFKEVAKIPEIIILEEKGSTTH